MAGGGARPAGAPKGPGFAISGPKEAVLEVGPTSRKRTGVKSDTQRMKAPGTSKVKEIKILKFDQRRQQERKNQQAIAYKKKSQELNHANTSSVANQIEENENENESEEQYSPLLFNDPVLADDDDPGHTGRYFDESPEHATIYYQRNERQTNEKNATSQVNLKLKNKLAPD